MAEIDGGGPDSTYGPDLPGQQVGFCRPDSAIWSPPVVVQPGEEGYNELEYELATLQIDLALDMAWSAIATLTAGSVSICPVTVRPCSRWGLGGSYIEAPAHGRNNSPSWPAQLASGDIVNVLTCGHFGACECSWVEKVNLVGPVGAVYEVMIDGVVLDPSAYRIDNGNELVRQDGKGWPYQQDMDLPAGEVGTWTVTYALGAIPDRLLNWAAGVLAAELLLSVQGKKCRLPKGTTAVTRQGVAYEVDKTWFVDGTGLPEVDHIIRRYNPYGLRTRPTVWSPDIHQPRRTTVES